jgi:biotin operon repressor
MSTARTVGPKELRRALVERLIEAGSWVEPRVLTRGLGCGAAVVDDALADLVIDGNAVFRKDAGYRLAGGPLARKAAQELRAKGLPRTALISTVGGVYRMGVAERSGQDGQELLMYELELPGFLKDLADLPRDLEVVDRFLTRSLSHGTSGV